MTAFEAAGPLSLTPTRQSQVLESGAETTADTAIPSLSRQLRPWPNKHNRQSKLSRVLSDPAAFSELLRLSALVGESLGVSARSLADGGSWAHVAEVAGVTRQAAWSRWRSDTL